MYKINKTKSSDNKNDNFEIKQDKKDRIITDPDGSWTGTPIDLDEKPIQDVDDL